MLLTQAFMARFIPLVRRVWKHFHTWPLGYGLFVGLEIQWNSDPRSSFFLTDGFEGWQMESYDMGVSQNELTTKIIGFLLDQNSFY